MGVYRAATKEAKPLPQTGAVTYHQLAIALDRKSPQTFRVGRLVEGEENPSMAVAYKFGRTLESKFGRPCSGFDGLIAGGFWADALACFGEFLYELTPEADIAAGEKELAVQRSVYGCDLYGKPLPLKMYPAIDKAWERWLEGPRTVNRLWSARIQAGYALALSPHPEDHEEAKRLLLRPVGPVGFSVNRKELVGA
jgi:hypothetical protein